MKFYNRTRELDLLNRLSKQSEQGPIMTVLMGRRRVGKTILALHHTREKPLKKFLYLFVGRKEEHLLCQEFLEEIQKNFDIPPIGNITQFKDIFLLILELSKREPITVIIDEFQEFYHVNKSVYSDIQKTWDLAKYTQDSPHKLHVIFIGSIYSLMHKIFEEEKQPLFGRADKILRVNAFSIETIQEILQDYDILTPESLFNYFVMTGGMPKYMDALLQEGGQSLDDLLEGILQKDSLFLREGQNLLIEEFGRDYVTYFSILELISQGKTSRGEIESFLSKDIGGYLQRLETDYAVIHRHRPITSKIHTRNQKYKITDNFLNFWFRFIYRYRSALEIENFSYIKALVQRDYSTYCGPILEDFFRKKLAETGNFNTIGAYWEKDNRNEIDIVAINDLDQKILICETKLNKSKINIHQLEEKSKSLLEHYPNYEPTYLALGLEDVLTDGKKLLGSSD